MDAFGGKESGMRRADMSRTGSPARTLSSLPRCAASARRPPFSYEILGLVGRGGAGAHDLLRMARHGRILDWAGESQYYVEPKRLAKLGYLEARKEAGKTRERTVYTLTEKGLDALCDYARTPVRFMPVKSDLLLRLLIADLVGERVTRESIVALREDLADLYARLDETKANTVNLPHRRKYLLLVVAFLRRLLELHEELVDEVERDLAPRRSSKPRRRGDGNCSMDDGRPV
jgi:DNA-binding PadR family transcriptional regulator